MKFKYFILVIPIIIGIIIITTYNEQAKNKTNAALNENIIHHINLTPAGPQPSVISVKIGEYLQINSQDGKKHNMALGRGDADHQGHDHVDGGESGEFGPNEAYKVKIKLPGTYYFHDHDNPATYIIVIAYIPENKK